VLNFELDSLVPPLVQARVTCFCNLLCKAKLLQYYEDLNKLSIIGLNSISHYHDCNSCKVFCASHFTRVGGDALSIEKVSNSFVSGILD
jgi:hypothetical protein